MDIIGHTFDRLTVMSFSHKNEQGRFYWNCTCACGGTLCTSGTALRTGMARSCGCLVREHVQKLHEGTVLHPGEVYGRLTVVQQAHTSPQGRIFWRCTCACGKERTVSGTSLRGGKTVSCGCARKGAHGTHGDSRSLTYTSWISMLHRCENADRKSYERYGGRGITVCKRWHKYENFLKDMGPRENTLLSLERRNNNLGYTPRNCYWASMKEQARNRANSVYVTYNSKTQVLSAWAEELGVSYSTLSGRRQQGWSDEEIICGRN